MDFTIIKGNIVDAKVDAIVLPANSKLKEGSGASEAIFKAAGRKQLTKKCNEIGFCEVGSATVTLGYDLGCKCIVHAVVPRWVDGDHDEYDLLSSAYVSALSVADAVGCKSIAFPLLASGNNGFDLELALEIAIKTIEAYESRTLEDVRIVIFGNRIASIAKEKGYDVGILPRNLERDEEERKKKEKVAKLFNDVKEVAAGFAEDGLQAGLDYLKDPENRKKTIEFGKKIAGVVLDR
ncbi:macro domain-containing protein [Butyrivibrio sp. FCS006]|uniref:macro domain-containing protein n=1 Tax=Butyrivibrio sp. FCS006 TaxID=1280684 RepID=UPI00040E2AD8|nr:macro domain-containing protein [Butyrivibrio sp. FCS006]